MSYPPGNPGYPPPAPTTQFAAPTQQFAKPSEQTPTGASKLPLYLSLAVALLGLGVYLLNFGPLFTISNSDFPQLGSASGSTTGLGLAVIASVVAALIAGAGVLAKQKPRRAWVAIVATLAFLLVLAEVINAPAEVSIGWALYVIIAFTFLQAGAAIANLLLDSGVITAPEPRQKYDQQQQYGGYSPQQQYYGQPQGQPQGQSHGQPQQLGSHQGQQRQGYPQQGYGYGGPSTGGFSGQAPQGAQGGQQSGPPTPPTGFPAYGQPQPPGSSADTGPQAQAQPQSAQQPQSTQQSTSPQGGPPPS
ncbi:DUF5336 domain-containing protein [Mycolicibacterium sp. GCM10028919]|uniref:DUF5336 domain-containing protein n=1 Tax=Mycolicibacterium sp. GCM10028919 TaxID=3273401 RepID=UPI003605E5A0